jgi:hypothetical protein
MSWLETAPSFGPDTADSLLSYNKAQLSASGDIYFVSLTGDDANSGTSWDDAFRTIIHAVSVVQPRDVIFIGVGTFDEVANGASGVVISTPLIDIVGVGYNTTITNTNTADGGSVITFTAAAIGANLRRAVIQKGETTSNNSIVIKINAYLAFIDGCTVPVEKSNHTGVEFTSGATFATIQGPEDTRSIIGTGNGGTGIHFNNATNCIVNNMIIAQLTTGIKFTTPAIVNGVKRNCDISGCDVGAELNAGVFGNVIGATFTNCAVSIIDNSGNGTNEQPSVSVVTPYAHEDMWPTHAGQGVAANPITISNLATDDTPVARDDQDFWGDTAVIIAVGAITKRWISNGVNVFSGVANKILRVEFYYPQTCFYTTRNGGNLWDLGETSLTVADGSVIEIGDKVWITSTSDPNGEILLVTNVVGNVITVASETRASGNTGIRYNHAGAETMYVVERDGLNRVDGHQTSFASANTKESKEKRWTTPKYLPPNAGMIGRLLNQDDNLAASVSVNVIYED